MATLNADNYSKMIAVPQEQLPVGDVSGKKRIAYDEITLSAELASGDLINVCAPLPANARVLHAIVKSGALGAGSLQLGHAADDDYFIAAASAAAAAKLQMASEAGLFAKSASVIQPQLKVSVAASTTGTGKKIQVMIEYVLE